MKKRKIDVDIENICDRIIRVQEEMSNVDSLKTALNKKGMLNNREIIDTNELKDNENARVNANQYKSRYTTEAEDNEESRKAVDEEWRHKKKELFEKSQKIGDAIKEAVDKKNMTPEVSEVLNNIEGPHLRTLPEVNDVKDVYETSTPYFNVAQETVTENDTPDTKEYKLEQDPRVNHPNYYNLEDGPYIIVDGKKVMIECIDVIRNMPTWKGNVIKYLWRCGEKKEEGLTNKQKEYEDMKKALWYLEDKIKELNFDTLNQLKK